MKKYPIEFFDCFTFLHDQFTKKHLSIVLAFLSFYKECLAGNHEKTFPSISLIAKMSGCESRTVNRFIKKYEGILLTHKNSRRVNGKHTSNQYDLNPHFFEWIMIIDYNGLFRNWTKKTRISLFESYMQNPWFLHEFLYRDKVMNKQMSHGNLSKCRTIKIFFLERGEESKDLQGSRFNNVLTPKKRGLGKVIDNGNCAIPGVLQGLPISNSFNCKVNSLFGSVALNHAKEVYLFAERKYGNIKNPENVIFSEARKKTIEILKRK